MNKNAQAGLLDVLLALKTNIMNSLQVSSLAKVKQIDLVKQKVIVQTFPLLENEEEKTITCDSVLIPYYDYGQIKYTQLLETLSKDDVVIVVFLNRNSTQSLKQAKTNNQLTRLRKNEVQHSENDGIVVGLLYKSQTN